MMESNDWLAGFGTGLGIAAGISVTSLNVGVTSGAMGITALAYVIVARIRERRREQDSEDSDEVATDGGTARRDPQPEAAPEQPAVLDVEVEGDRVLGSAERGDVALVVEAPAGISEEELEATLDDLPERMTRTAALFDRGDD